MHRAYRFESSRLSLRGAPAIVPRFPCSSLHANHPTGPMLLSENTPAGLHFRCSAKRLQDRDVLQILSLVSVEAVSTSDRVRLSTLQTIYHRFSVFLQTFTTNRPQIITNYYLRLVITRIAYQSPDNSPAKRIVLWDWSFWWKGYHPRMSGGGVNCRAIDERGKGAEAMLPTFRTAR